MRQVVVRQGERDLEMRQGEMVFGMRPVRGIGNETVRWME